MEQVKSIKQPNKEMIEILESILEKAKAGDINSIAFIYERFDTDMVHGFAGSACNVFAMIGKMRVLERDYMDLNVNLLRCPQEIYCE